MDQQAFKTMLESEGFEVVVVEREANISMDLHSHPFEAKAMILELRGAKSFDQAYANNQVKAHEETIELFKKQANTVTDDKVKGAPELKAFAQKMLPALEKHLAAAKELQAKHPSK